MPRYLTVLSIFVCPSRSWTALIAGAPIDQGCFGASQRMRPKKSRVQAHAANPLLKPGAHIGGWSCWCWDRDTATTCEQELAGPLASSLQIIIGGLAGLLAQFKSDGPPRPTCGQSASAFWGLYFVRHRARRREPQRLLEALAEHGWIEGRTLIVDCVAPGLQATISSRYQRSRRSL